MRPNTIYRCVAEPVRLFSVSCAHLLEIRLATLQDVAHSEWFTYRIEMIDAASGGRWSLETIDEPVLFLARIPESEVTLICDGLRRVLDDDAVFSFEPIDERDFALHVTPAQTGVALRLQFLDKPAPDMFGWPRGALVERTALRAFADHLALQAQVLEKRSA